MKVTTIRRGDLAPEALHLAALGAPPKTVAASHNKLRTANEPELKSRDVYLWMRAENARVMSERMATSTPEDVIDAEAVAGVLLPYPQAETAARGHGGGVAGFYWLVRTFFERELSRSDAYVQIVHVMRTAGVAPLKIYTFLKWWKVLMK